MICKSTVALRLLFAGLLIISIVTRGYGLTKYSPIPTPASHFGFTPGDDRMLFKYEDVIDYFKILEKESPKVKMEKIGNSELGKPMYLLFVSSDENIANIDNLKDINRQIALDPELSDYRKNDLLKNGKVFFLMTLSMHASEVGPAQAAPLIIYELITSEDPEIKYILDNTVYMITPSHNPDGMNMIVDNYNEYKDTRYEGSSLPGVYHKYVGHNINRDFITLSMSENEAISRVFSKEWFPQLSVEKHQMGSRGPRYYVSPPHDPVSENILPGLWNWKRIFGSRSLNAMTEAGLKGVSTNYVFDMYWPGNASTGLWKGIIAMLSEAASVNIATPLYIEPSELTVTGKGLAEYDISINMPDPWPGGWWHLSDIVEYERVNTLSYLYTAAIHRKEILRYRNDITRKEIERGSNIPPYYYIFPAKQHDRSELADLINLMDKHGVNSYRLLKDQVIDNILHMKGDVVIPLAQPYRSFIKEVLESQEYPVRHYTRGGDMIRPYDITSWSLPLHKGVKSFEVNSEYKIPEEYLQIIETPFGFLSDNPDSFTGVLFTATNNESYKAAFKAIDMGMKVERIVEGVSVNGNDFPEGSFYIASNGNMEELTDQLLVKPFYLAGNLNCKTVTLQVPRIALIESWFHDMDAGWTRYLFDTYKIPYRVLRPSEIEDTGLYRDFDVIILPDQSQAVLMAGKAGSPGNYSITRYPPEYAKGMGEKGLNNLLKFLDKGGRLVSWGKSTEIFMGNLAIEDDENEKQEFSLPVRNIGSSLENQGLDVAGSFLRVKLRPDHPLTLGMPEYTGVFHRGNPVFATNFPYFDMDRRVIAAFPDNNILLSGHTENEKLLSGQAAMVWVKKGKGQIVMFSFCPQFRGSTPATYKLLFNTLLLE